MSSNSITGVPHIQMPFTEPLAKEELLSAHVVKDAMEHTNRYDAE